MPRLRKARNWVKMDCDGVLKGSINYLFLDDGISDENLALTKCLAFQAIWLKMIAYSEICGGRAGYIEDNNQKGLPRNYVAQELHCSLEQLNEVLEIMESDGAVKINGTGSIFLVNFKLYQFNEYDRQKTYRQKSGDGPQTFEEYVEAIRGDYPELNIDNELKKFQLWWAEGKKELKRPKFAFKNWCDKAREITANGTHRRSDKAAGNTSGDTGQDGEPKYARGKYKDFVRH